MLLRETMFTYHVLVFCSALLTVCFLISGCLFMSCVKIKLLWLFMFFYHHVSVLCCQQLSAGPCFCRCCWPRLCCSISWSLLLYCVADRDYVFLTAWAFFCAVLPLEGPSSDRPGFSQVLDTPSSAWAPLCSISPSLTGPSYNECIL